MPTELHEFTGHLEQTIRNSLSSISAHAWDEDHITYTLLKDLQSALKGSRFSGHDPRSAINWETYKLKGSYETDFGDIALVVNINYKDGSSVNGVAFLEAKKRDWRKTTFSAMRVNQAKRILKNAPRAQYLLYDYDEITGFLNGSLYSDEMEYYYFRRGLTVPFSPITRSVCVPLNLALTKGDKDTLLYRHGLPLSFVLSTRYFQGLDLEFDEKSKQVATGFLNKFGLSKYVVKVDIIESGAELSDDDLRVNQAEYIQAD
ncbi:hypothetical protein [Vreelandella titanicae]|uniref:hypothetical protein n=1 Tax=Vreelandella titanicae TaxID=664683 RepID=UPI0016811412|nr:hypothetical protein [Halomonas titanicae]QNU62906.1 hypothetical protein HZS52_00580 [Halomonas titanicae]